MAKRHYLDPGDMATIRTLVARHGLRPVVDAVGAAAVELSNQDIPVADEYGDPMDASDIQTAAANLAEGLY